MYHFLSTETNYCPNFSIAFEKPRRHKLYPFVHENKYNYYNKNNLKMKKLKQSYEEQKNLSLKETQKETKNIKSTFSKGCDPKEKNPYIGKNKYRNSRRGLDSMSTAVTEPVKLTVSSSPVIFLADNINTDNEIEKIKFLKSGYSSSSTNTERNK